jgi:hypothetical protein
MFRRKCRQSEVPQTTEMEHFLCDGGGVRKEVNSCGCCLGAECRDQDFGFFGDDYESGRRGRAVKDPLNGTLGAESVFVFVKESIHLPESCRLGCRSSRLFS